MSGGTDELPAWMLEEDDNSNTSWDTMDEIDWVTGNYIGQICQLRGTTIHRANSLYGELFGRTKKGHFAVRMPLHEKPVVIPMINVYVQTTASLQESLMLPNGRYLKPFY